CLCASVVNLTSWLTRVHLNGICTKAQPFGLAGCCCYGSRGASPRWRDCLLRPRRNTMSFKDILVTLAGVTASETGINFAVELARGHGAHLVGLSILEPLDLSAQFAPDSGYMAVDVIQEIEETHRKSAQAAASKIEAAFRAACSRAGISHEWRFAEGNPAEAG